MANTREEGVVFTICMTHWETLWVVRSLGACSPTRSHISLEYLSQYLSLLYNIYIIRLFVQILQLRSDAEFVWQNHVCASAYHSDFLLANIVGLVFYFCVERWKFCPLILLTKVGFDLNSSITIPLCPFTITLAIFIFLNFDSGKVNIKILTIIIASNHRFPSQT